MAKVVLAWEFGAERGHITRFCGLARALLARGHTVYMIVCDRSLVGTLLSKQELAQLNIIQLPSLSPGKPQTEPVNYSELLLVNGYYSAPRVGKLVDIWRQLFDQINPHIVYFDFAPAALLAARGFNFQKVALGIGFTLPPNVSPWPCFLPESQVSMARLMRSDQTLNDVLNYVAKALGLGVLASAQELFCVEKRILLSILELDPYAHYRREEEYFGAIELEDDGLVPTWSVNKPRIFGYLKLEFQQLERLLGLIKNLSISANIFIPGADSRLRNAYTDQNTTISAQPFQTGLAMRETDYFICHGGHNFSFSGLQAKKPGLIIPLQIEQGINAYHLSKQGLSIAHNPFDADLAGALNELITSKSLRENLATMDVGSTYISLNKFLDHTLPRCFS